MRSIYSIIAYCFDYIGNESLVVLFYEMAIQVNDSYGYNGIGVHYRKLGQYDIAKKYLMKALNLNNAPSMFNLALLESNTKNNDYSEQIEYYKMAIKYKLKCAARNLAILYEKMGRYDLAISYFLVEIKQHNSKKAMKDLAELNKLQSKLGEALIYFRMAAEQTCLNSIQSIFSIMYYEKKYVNYDDINKYAQMIMNHYDSNSKFYKKKYKSLLAEILLSAARLFGKLDIVQSKKYYFLGNTYDININLAKRTAISKYLELCDASDLQNIEQLYLQNNNIHVFNKLYSDIYANNTIEISRAKIDIYASSCQNICRKYLLKYNSRIIVHQNAVKNNEERRSKYIARLCRRFNMNNNSIKPLEKDILIMVHNRNLLIMNKKYDNKLFRINLNFNNANICCEVTAATKLKYAHRILNNIPPYKLSRSCYHDIVVELCN